MLKNLKLKQKILLMFIITGMIPFLLIGFFSYNKAKNDIRNEVIKGNNIFLNSAITQLNDYFEQRKEDGKVIASTKYTYESIQHFKEKGENPIEWENIYKKLDEFYSIVVKTYNYNYIYITDCMGNIIYSSNKEIEGGNLLKREYIKNALKDQQNWTALFYSDLTNKNTMVLSNPVYKEGTSGEIIGTINFVMEQEDLDHIVHNGIELLGESGDSYLVKSDGTLLTNTRLGNFTKDGALKEKIDTKGVSFLREAMNSKNLDYKGNGEYKDYLNNSVLGSFGVIDMGSQPVGLIIEVNDEEVFKELNVFKNSILIGMLILFIVGIGLALVIANLISKPVDKTNDLLKDIAQGEGDLTKTLNVQSKDEIGILAKWFNVFVSRIKDVIKQVKNNADTLSASSEQLAAAIEQANEGIENIATEINKIAYGLERNSRIVEEATTSIEGMYNGAMIIAEESENVNKNSGEVLAAANYGGEQLNKVVEAIDRVKNSSSTMYSVVGELKNSSSKIGQIISIITGISEKTNLLALNATIEAARAGEHGRGFAVVADEVRKLSEESKNSADKIIILIHEIEKNTQITHETIKKEQQLVEMSVEKVNDTNIEFNKILRLIEQVTKKIDAISSSAKEQSKVAEDMAKSMDEISNATQDSVTSSQQISANVEEAVGTFEEIGASIEELNLMSRNLKEQTDKFKVN